MVGNEYLLQEMLGRGTNMLKWKTILEPVTRHCWNLCIDWNFTSTKCKGISPKLCGLGRRGGGVAWGIVACLCTKGKLWFRVGRGYCMKIWFYELSWSVKGPPLTLELSGQICNSPYCQLYNSYNISSENLVLDHLIIPKLIYSFVLITYLVDIVLIL